MVGLRIRCVKRVIFNEKRTDFEIWWLSFDEMKASASLLETNCVNAPYFEVAFSITDGGRIPSVDYIDADLHNNYFGCFT